MAHITKESGAQRTKQVEDDGFIKVTDFTAENKQRQAQSLLQVACR